MGIDLQLNFDQPLEIITSDQLEVTLNFKSFEPSMPDGFILKKKLSKQFPKDTAPLLEQIGSGIQIASVSILAGKLVLQGSLSQILGMIGGIQLMISIPLFTINFPANSYIIVTNLNAIANFDIPHVNMLEILGPTLWDLGEDDSVLGDVPNNEAMIDALDLQGYNTRFVST